MSCPLNSWDLICSVARVRSIVASAPLLLLFQSSAAASPIEIKAPAPAPEPATAAHVARSAALFEEVGPSARLSECLKIIAECGALETIGPKRWKELVARKRSLIESARSHEEFAARMNDLMDDAVSHFHYLTQEDFGYWLLRSALESPPVPVEHVGLFPEKIEGRWFVRGVLEGAPAVASEIPICVGDEIISVEGAEYRPFSSFRGRAGRPTRVTFRRSPNADYTVTLTPRREPLSVAVQKAIRPRVIEEQGYRLAYLHSWTLLGGAEFDELRKLEPRVDGLLLDFRDGYGGTWMKACEFLLGDRLDGQGEIHKRWRKPVVILTDDGTRSAKEIVVAAVKKHTDILLVGEPTPGHVTSVGGLRRVGDALLELPGQRFSQEGKPVIPDIEVKRDIRYCAGRDPQLNAAKAELIKQLRK